MTRATTHVFVVFRFPSYGYCQRRDENPLTEIPEGEVQVPEWRLTLRLWNSVGHVRQYVQVWGVGGMGREAVVAVAIISPNTG